MKASAATTQRFIQHYPWKKYVQGKYFQTISLARVKYFIKKNTDFRQRFLLFECFYALIFDDDSILRLAS